MSEILQIEVEYFLLCISTLFVLVNPLGIAPIFVIMTERFDHESRKSIAKKGIITAGITLIIFAGFGSLIFKLYSITIEAFQIMGGIILFRSGLRMLEAKIGRTRTTPAEQDESMDRDDNRNQRRHFQHIDQLISQRRQNATYCLGQNDKSHSV